jgi:hypothetical protein
MVQNNSIELIVRVSNSWFQSLTLTQNNKFSLNLGAGSKTWETEFPNNQQPPQPTHTCVNLCYSDWQTCHCCCHSYSVCVSNKSQDINTLWGYSSEMIKVLGVFSLKTSWEVYSIEIPKKQLLEMHWKKNSFATPHWHVNVQWGVAKEFFFQCISNNCFFGISILHTSLFIFCVFHTSRSIQFHPYIFM